MFHVVTAIQTHFYWDDLNLGLSEIYRVLKQGGKLAIICENDKIEYHLPEYKEISKMKVLLESIGFVNIEFMNQGNWIEYICYK